MVSGAPLNLAHSRIQRLSIANIKPYLYAIEKNERLWRVRYSLDPNQLVRMDAAQSADDHTKGRVRSFDSAMRVQTKGHEFVR